VTRNNYGAGIAYYLGAIPERRFLEVELSPILSRAGVAPVLECPGSLWALRRTGPGGDVIFVLNPTDTAETVPLKGKFRDVLDGSELSGALSLGPYDLRVFMA
jgi:beta-galactosidase